MPLWAPETALHGTRCSSVEAVNGLCSNASESLVSGCRPFSKRGLEGIERRSISISKSRPPLAGNDPSGLCNEFARLGISSF